jgi:ribosomal-protein-alanine N-acetyltransferase
MRHFPGVLTRTQSDALLDRIELDFEQHGYGLWAVEVSEGGELVGFTGLAIPSFEAHFTPAVETGWRLAYSTWGRGYATEAAQAALGFAFETLGLAEVVSFTSVENALASGDATAGHDP